MGDEGEGRKSVEGRVQQCGENSQDDRYAEGQLCGRMMSQRVAHPGPLMRSDGQRAHEESESHCQCYHVRGGSCHPAQWRRQLILQTAIKREIPACSARDAAERSVEAVPVAGRSQRKRGAQFRPAALRIRDVGRHRAS